MTSRSQGFGSGPLAGALPGRAAFRGARAEPVEAAPPLIGIGSMLREARERLGLTYAEVERTTHISRHHLQALEEERFDAFSARVYVRGFLRSYSQHLGLDATEVVALLPPERPVEEDRLLPLSRLGRPRGPREAARARRHPIARDATPLTDATLASTTQSLADAEWEWASAGPRLSFGANSDAAPDAARLDPLGHLGWPADADDPDPAHSRAESSASAPYEPGDDEEIAHRQAVAASITRERHLGARRTDRTLASNSLLDAIPDDVRPLFSRQALPGALVIVIALFVFWVATLAIGGDASPTAVASSAAGSVAVATALPPAPSLPRGQMLDLHGRDLQAAVGALAQLGITPVVVEQTSSGALSGQVLAQTPAPGAPLRTDTPVMLVVGQP